MITGPSDIPSRVSDIRHARIVPSGIPEPWEKVRSAGGGIGSCLPDPGGDGRCCGFRCCHPGQDIARTGQNMSPLQGYRVSGCTACNGFPVQSRACCRLRGSFDSPYLRTQSCLLNRLLFRTRERVAGLHKYPHCEAGNIRCTGLYMPEPGDDYPRYPEILTCLFSFFLPPGNHLHFLMTARPGSHPASP